MQSLGRGLGLSKFKDKYEVYDIVDKFDKVLDTRKLISQRKVKENIYKENKYDYDIVYVNVK